MRNQKSLEKIAIDYLRNHIPEGVMEKSPRGSRNA